MRARRLTLVSAVLPDGDIGCLYEGGETRYGKTVFARFPLEWLTDGEDGLSRNGDNKDE